MTQQGVFDGVFDKVAGEYDTAGVVFFKPLAERLVEHLGIGEGARVLDIGAGRGAVTFPLAEMVGPTGKVYAIDVSTEMVEALGVAASEHDNIAVRRMDGVDPTFAPGDFDAVTGSMSIILLPDLPTAFGNYAQLLKPGGTLAFTAPDTRNQEGAWKSGPVDVGKLAAAIPAEVMAANPMLARLVEGNLLDLSAMPGLLERAGFVDVVEHREEVTVVAESPESVVHWTQQHGMRAVWDFVPEERRVTVERELVADATAAADTDGRVRFGFPVAYFLANTPRSGCPFA
jgi:ubiquinone/menaquinone biosynthesis C-methylase UbiE